MPVHAFACHADNCIVIAQGVLASDGVFHVHQLGFPPVELKEDMAEACKVVLLLGAELCWAVLSLAGI